MPELKKKISINHVNKNIPNIVKIESFPKY